MTLDPTAASRTAAASLVPHRPLRWAVPLTAGWMAMAVMAGGCGHSKPESTAITGSGGDSTGGGSGGAGGTDGAPFSRSCDDIGTEPVIPQACATVLGTKTVTGGIPTDESTLDTQAIQDAINACPSGQAVRLAPDGDNVALLSGPLSLRSGVTLWIDAGITLFASRNPRDFDTRSGACAGNNTGSSACSALINVRNQSNAAVMGLGSIDGRGGETIAGTTTTWWDLEGTYNGNLAAPRLVQVNQGSGFVLYQVSMHNAAKFHVVIEDTVGFVVWGITINTPSTSPNTDGVDPSASSNGVIVYNKITTGDDNIAIKGSGPPVVDNIVIAHNHFGRGHGMSIGSETYGGVQNVRVCDLSLDGTQNGLRIKSDSSRGGLVQNISYTDVCMRSVGSPLIFDPYYSSSTGTQIPDYRNIYVKNVHVLGGGRTRFRGWDAAHPLIINLDNVRFDGTPTVAAQDTQITLGPDPVTLSPNGTNVTLTNNVTGTASARTCDDAWITF